MHLKLIVLSAIVVSLVHAVSDREWSSYKQKFKKYYKDPKDDAHHRSTYENNCHEINEHNQRYKEGKESWKKGVNQFTDLTDEESKWSRGYGPID